MHSWDKLNRLQLMFHTWPHQEITNILSTTSVAVADVVVSEIVVVAIVALTVDTGVLNVVVNIILNDVAGILMLFLLLKFCCYCWIVVVDVVTTVVVVVTTVVVVTVVVAIFLKLTLKTMTNHSFILKICECRTWVWLF